MANEIMSTLLSSSSSRLAAALSIVLIVALVPAAAAQTTATLAGSVLDASGSTLPGVQMTLRQPSTGFIRSTVTGSEGRFVLAGLSAGVYELRAELSGFRPVSRADIAVTVGEMVSLPPMTLAVGGIQEVLTVSGAMASVNTQSSELSYLVNEQAVSSLPLNG